MVLSYHPFTYEAPATFRAFPLLLKEYNGRWFLIGHNPDRDFVQNFALDRIVGVDEDNTISEPALSFDPITYYQHIIGVSTAEAGIEVVRFRTAPVLRRYLETKPLHATQRLLNDQESIFEVSLGVNFELKAKLLSYGPALTVLEPQHLRNDLAEQYRLAAAQHMDKK